MSARSLSLKSTTGVVAFYMSGSSSPADCDLAADLMGAAVFRGQRQRNAALRASRGGAMVWLDPADYERKHTRRHQPSLFGDDPWAEDQRAVGVVELLSPGVFVPMNDVRALDAAIATQIRWLEAQHGGRMSLALDWHWLTEGLPALLSTLVPLGAPIAVALADPKDPLEHRGAVRGLATLASEAADLMILRCDMGALGAIAHGATVAAIGTGTSVRHVVPAGRRAHGSGNPLPNVFVESLLDFRSLERLAQLPDRLKPECALTCCGGAQLDRFLYKDDAPGVRIHNLHALANVADRILGSDDDARPSLWTEMAREAVVEAQRIHMEAGQPFAVRRQIEAWAIL
jgi:hypothetical protein